jgi:hypothetical protein
MELGSKRIVYLFWLVADFRGILRASGGQVFQIARGGLTPGPSPKERGDNDGQINFWKNMPLPKGFCRTNEIPL